MNELDEIEGLCEFRSSNTRILYWSSEIYGFGVEFRKYGFYPRFWPLNVYSSHGVAISNNPFPHELNSKAPVMLFFSRRLVKKFKEVSNKPCYVVISPFVYYRRRRKIRQSKKASGTVVFVSHSTPDTDNEMEMDSYIFQLKEIDKKFQPLTICLHSHDVKKGLHKQFIANGFKVATAGHPNRKDYIVRFYNILKSHKYASSNLIGSYTFYSIEMDIPFFLYGHEPIYNNFGNDNLERGILHSYKEDLVRNKAKMLFENCQDEVTSEQKVFVEEQLGVNDTISRLKMAEILYKNYLYFLFQNPSELLFFKKFISRVMYKFFPKLMLKLSSSSKLKPKGK